MKMKTWMRWTGRTLAAAGIVLLAGCERLQPHRPAPGGDEPVQPDVVRGGG